ncbi:hypothetical protein DF034_17475 [Burkholderia anthina]|uniref:beta strand repeat-containing protein n=1 Tax=Burkholderia anthina TaxID=179879 RepID=UPI000F5DA60E|nr:glycosyl hydrolase family 28-related protein [Burkholderia anthina]RQX81806.1 hypothetical protein DF034_17475 [Burkholderia anthina]
MKNFLAALMVLACSAALAQNYPSPTFNNATINGTATIPHAAITGGTITGLSSPVPVASGGTNSASPSGTALDNITGFASTGFLTRTGAGAYSFQSLTNGIALSNIAQIAGNTLLGNATGSTASVAAVTVTGCNGAAQALQWTNGSGFQCNSSIATSGANANITSLSGLTTALSIGQGGTGASTALGATANIQFQQSGTGAVSRSVQSKLADHVNVLDFGADATGASDSTTAINNALTAFTQVLLPPGTFKVSGSLVLTKNGHSLIGSGVGVTTITNSSTSASTITANASLTNLLVTGFTLTRSATAVSGAEGIDFSNIMSLASIHDVITQNNWDGVKLGPTDFSTMYNVVSQKNLNYGVWQVNSAVSGQCQWYPSNVLVQENGNNGWLVQSSAGPTAIALGTYRDIYSFANSGRGMIFLGSAGVPINGVRIIGGFIGQDANSEVYLDTYGDQHMIEGTFFELAGTAATGPTLSTPASNIGSGVEITGNNTTVQLVGTHANGNSLDGYYLAGTAEILTGVRATNNGLAGTANRQNGVNVAAGRAVINGSLLGNVGASTSQKYGVLAADGNNVSLTGNDLTNNNTGAWNATANLTSVSSIGNLPNNLNVNVSPTGAVIVGSGATGGFANGAGTINVSGGLLKNNSAYTNP